MCIQRSERLSEFNVLSLKTMEIVLKLIMLLYLKSTAFIA